MQRHCSSTAIVSVIELAFLISGSLESMYASSNTAFPSFYRADSKGSSAAFTNDSFANRKPFNNAQSKESYAFYEAEKLSEGYESDEVDDNQERFFDDVVEGRVRLNGDDPFWEIKSTLNASLSRLFNKQPQFRGDESPWERPQTYGLQNSTPIIPTHYNQAKAEQQTHHSESKRQVHGEAGERSTLYDLIRANGVTYETTRHLTQQPQAKAQQAKGIELEGSAGASFVSGQPTVAANGYAEDGQNDEDEEEDEDGDEDYDDGGGDEDYDEDEVFRRLNAGGLSASLMQALGIQSSQAQSVAVEWVPPSRAGLDNSDRK